MSADNFWKFDELLRNDEGLQAKLQELGKGYTGDRTDDKAIFEATLGKLAAEEGLPFTYDEGISSLSSGHELADSELDAVAGGDGACILIGVSSEVEAECDEIDEGHACAYIGVGVVTFWW
ncbi:MAG: hypothetical protein K5859_07545 [Atopobiaceae bacterium]|nr:hypothetical protein [Atopobiaceae bacterium]